MEVLGVFCLAGSLEFLWSQMMEARDRGLIAKTVAWNFLLDLAGTLATWFIIEDLWYIIPSLAGGGLGLAIGLYKTKTPRSFDPGV